MEENLRKCKDCGEIKKRILVGRFDDVNKKYHDENGKTWNGTRCPSCHVKQVRVKTKLTRSLK